MSEFSISNVNNLFKIKYGKLSENVYNSANVLLGRIQKKYDFTGKQMFVPVPTSYTGGVGSGSLPKANHADVQDANIFAKKVYARMLLDREAMKAASNDEGAFVRATKWQTQKCVESYMRNMSRILFGDGSGSLGIIGAGGVTDNGGGNYSVVISDASFKEANIEEQDYVNVGSGSTDLMEVISLDVDTKTVVLQRITGSIVPAAADVIFMQGSENNDPKGLKGVLDFGHPGDLQADLYGIAPQRRWKSTRLDMAGAGLSTDKMNEVMLEIQRKSGKVPNLIMTSFTQFRKLLNLLEDQKQYIVEPRAKDLQGKISFKGIEFMSTAGSVAVFPERFCEDDRMYFLNDNYMTTYHRPGHGWFSDDGTVLLRSADQDSYEARYGGYLECYIVPSFMGGLVGLAV